MAASSLPLSKWTMFGQSTPFVGFSILDLILDKAIGQEWQDLPIGEIVGRVGLEFLGTPYVGWTLERDVDREFCFVTLEGLDCVTFFESSLCIARALKSWSTFERRPPKPTATDLIREVTSTRYRGGIVGDYSSRLHYTTDWIRDNYVRGNARDMASVWPGSILESKPIDFMTKHVDTYRQLRAHPELVPKIARVEAEMTRRGFRYFPTATLNDVSPKLRSGDIIGLVSKTPGMDVDHTGLIVVENGKPVFVHASSTQKKVVKDKPLAEVDSASGKYLGIVVARPMWDLESGV